MFNYFKIKDMPLFFFGIKQVNYKKKIYVLLTHTKYYVPCAGQHA